MTQRSRSTDQKMSDLVATMIEAAGRRKTPPRPRTYVPGSRELKSYSTPRVIREIYRRACESHGKLSDKDWTMYSVELQRRELAVTSTIVTGLVVSAVMTPLVNKISEQGFNESLGEIDALAQEVLNEEPATFDESFMEPMTSSDLLADMREQGIQENVVSHFDAVADVMVTDLGQAIEQQNALTEPELAYDPAALESPELDAGAAEL